MFVLTGGVYSAFRPFSLHIAPRGVYDRASNRIITVVAIYYVRHSRQSHDEYI